MPSAPVLEIFPYEGWKEVGRLCYGDWELLAPLEVGPRILRLGPVSGPNLFYEDSSQLGKTGGDSWKIYGGHRFWTAPENEDSYAPDNEPVTLKELGLNGFCLSGPANLKSGWQKSVALTWQEDGLIRLEHTLTNLRAEPLPQTPWCLTVLAAGGSAFVPQPPFRPHPSELPPGQNFPMSDYLPNRNLVLWPFTSLSDPRISLGADLWRLDQQAGCRAFKIGFRHTEGWIGYQLGDLFFAKWIQHDALASYPDRGSNAELFTNGDILEVESLAPDCPVPAKGSVTHTEWWHVGRVAFSKQDHAAVMDYLRTLPIPNR
jgi:hypothetical protein